MGDEVLPFPRELIIGTTANEWPLVVFAKDAHALSWVADGSGGWSRRLFRVRVDVLQELEYVPPGQPSLRPRGTA